MGKFDEIRKIMKEFKGDMDSLASNKINEEQTARARLNPTALEEELTSLAAEYDGHFKSTRNRYKERLNEAIADRRKGNSNKYATGYIDYYFSERRGVDRAGISGFLQGCYEISE